MPHLLPAQIMDSCDGLFYCFALWAYSVTGGMFWTLMLMGFGVMLFIGSQRFGTNRAFGFASVSCLLGAIWLSVMQLMPWWVASAFILTGVAGFAVLIMNER